MRGQQALRKLYDTPAAIYEPALIGLIDIVERAAESRDVDLEAIAAKVGKPLDYTRNVEVRDGVAIIPVEGPMFRHANLLTRFSGATTYGDLAQDFETAKQDPSIKAILLCIDSPGGEVNGCNELSNMVYDARGVKPIVAYAAHHCCSAAMWLASSCDEVVADATAVLGSIGVVAAIRNERDPKRIEMTNSKSPNKRLDIESKEGRAALLAELDATAEVFIQTMARNRGVSVETVETKFGQGGVLVGQQAVDAGLADRLGSFEQVLMELATGGTNEYQGGTMGLFGKNAEGGLTVAVNVMDLPEVKTALAEASGLIDGLRAELEQERTQKAEALAELERAETANASNMESYVVATAALEATRAQVIALQAEARLARFAALIDGGKARPAWAGDAGAHLTVLTTLADAHGEDSVAFAAYVESQHATAAQLEQSDLFKPIGSEASNGPGGTSEKPATAQLNRMATQRAKEDGIDFTKALGLVTKENPALYQDYRAENQRKTRGGK